VLKKKKDILFVYRALWAIE